MGLLSLFVKPRPANTDNRIPGPTFLEGITAHIEQPRNLLPNEWRRKLRTAEGNEWFRIWYYGHQLDGRDPLIVATEFAPVLMYAEDTDSGRRILLFDGCRHGYNALFRETFTEEQVENRPLTHCFSDGYGNDVFRVQFSAVYKADYDDMQESSRFRNSIYELKNNAQPDPARVKRNAFSAFRIFLSNRNGETITILSEEPA